MEKVDLEKLKVKPEDTVKGEEFNKLVDAIIEINESLMEHAKHPGIVLRTSKGK